MRLATTLLLALLSTVALAQGDLGERTASLEQEVAALHERVAQLEHRMAIPAPPAGSMQVDEFTFTRLTPRQTVIGLEVVGEVSAPTGFSRVEFRVTYYAEDGSILETGTFAVENVGTTPRTFDAGMFSDTLIEDVYSIAIQVERIR